MTLCFNAFNILNSTDTHPMNEEWRDSVRSLLTTYFELQMQNAKYENFWEKYASLKSELVEKCIFNFGEVNGEEIANHIMTIEVQKIKNAPLHLRESNKDHTVRNSKISHRGFLSEIINNHVFNAYTRMKSKEYDAARKKGMSHHDAVEHAHNKTMDIMSNDKHSEHGRLKVTHLLTRAEKLPKLGSSHLKKLKISNPRAYENYTHLTKIKNAHKVLGDKEFRKILIDSRYATLDMINQIHNEHGEIMASKPTGHIGPKGVAAITGGRSSNADTLLTIRRRGKNGKHQSSTTDFHGVSLKVQTVARGTFKARTNTHEVQYNSLSEFDKSVKEKARKIENDYHSKLAAHNLNHRKTLDKIFRNLNPGHKAYGKLRDNYTVVQKGWSHIRDMAKKDPEVALYYKGVKALHGERNSRHNELQKSVIKKVMQSTDRNKKTKLITSLLKGGVGEQEIPTDIYSIGSFEKTDKGRRINRAKAIKKNKEGVNISRLEYRENDKGSWGFSYPEDKHFRVNSGQDISKEGYHRINFTYNPNAAGQPAKEKKASSTVKKWKDWRANGKSLLSQSHA